MGNDTAIWIKTFKTEVVISYLDRVIADIYMAAEQGIRNQLLISTWFLADRSPWQRTSTVSVTYH